MVKFFIEKRKEKHTNTLISKNVPIILDYSFNGKRFQHFTGYRVDADKWDDGIERTEDGNKTRKRLHEGKIKRNVKDSAKINNQLSELSNKVIKICETAKLLNVPLTPEYIRNELGNNEMKKKLPSVLVSFKIFIDERKNRDAVNTLKKYKSTYNHFSEYCKGKNIHFHDLNLSFLNGFKSFLINDKEHTHNTVVKYCKTLKTFLVWAEVREDNKCLEYKKFKVETEKEPAVIYLNWDELMLLYNLKIDNDKLRHVRDVFCFGCFTGQRFSDYENLKSHHIVDNIWINTPIKSHNTESLHIPLNNFAKAILDKYKNLPNGRALPIVSNAKMNLYLKELGELAGLNTPIIKYRFKGNKRIEVIKKKYEVLTTHIMRKTFITNALSLGISVEIVKEFTGHSKKNNKDFIRYFKILPEDRIKAMKLFNIR